MHKKQKIIFNDLETHKISQQPQALTSRILFKSRYGQSRNSKSSKASPNREFSRKVSEILLPVAEKVHKKIQLVGFNRKSSKNTEKKDTPVLSPAVNSKLTHRRVLSDGCPTLSQGVFKGKEQESESSKVEVKVKQIHIKSQSLAKIKKFNEKSPEFFQRCQSPSVAESYEKKSLVKYISQHFSHFSACPETTIEFYKVVNLIGKGAFAKVLLCEHKLTGKKVAVKAIPKISLQNTRSQKKVIQEVYIMKKIRSKFVVKVLEVFESEKNFLIVMEHAGGGDLLHYVRDKKRLKEEEAKRIFKQILLAAQAIHQAGVLHRDFKLDNILLDSIYSTIKVCDFGVSKIIKEGEVVLDQCGTPAYLAPEIIKGEGYEGFGVDVWSLGVVLYTILCGTIPFKATNINDLHKVILSGNFDLPFELSDQAKDLISKMIKLNPNERISVEHALKHNWFFVRAKEVDRSNPQFFPRIFKEKDEEIRESVVLAVSELGFEYEFIVKSLKNCDMNQATASYYLMI
jgi:serine/threonine protein kinase